MEKKSVLITGTSNGGIGSALALAFQKKGLLVFAGVRKLEKASDLANVPDLHLLTLDVTLSSSIAAAVETIKHATAGRGLDILVNNSGVFYTMPLVDSPLEEGKRLFDVNFWGTLAMVKAFTPQLLERKGIVVNISSISSLVHFPWIGLYSASKAAINIMSDILRLELAPFGITVLNIITGSIKSNIFANQEDFRLPPDSIYLLIESTLSKKAEGTGNPESMATDIYANQVVLDILGGTYGTIYRGNLVNIARFLSSLVPTFVLDRILSASKGLNELAKSIKDHSR